MKKSNILAILLSAINLTQIFSFGPPVSESGFPTRFFLAGQTMHRRCCFENETLITQRINGGMMGFEHLQPESIFWRLQLSYAEGSTQKDEWYDHEYDSQVHLGYSFNLIDQTLSLTPYAGFGYFVDNKCHYNQSDFMQRYQYVPVGFLLDWSISDYYALAFRSQVDVMLQRTLKVNGHRFVMQKKPIWVNELPLSVRFLDKLEVALVPFFHYAANVDYSFNATSHDWGEMKTLGARFEIGYKF